MSEQRTGTIVLTQNESGKTITITVTQEGCAPPQDVYEFSALTSEFSFGCEGDTSLVRITSTKNGVIQFYEVTSCPSWCSVEFIEEGLTDFMATVEPNE